MNESQHASVEARLAELEKYVKDDLWVTNRVFWKRTVAIYGHYLLGGLVLAATILAFMAFVMIMSAIFAGFVR